MSFHGSMSANSILLYLYLSLLLLLLNEELKIKRTNAMEIHTSVKINFELEGEPSQSWLAGGSQTLPPTIHEYIYRDISPIPHEHDYYYCVCLCFVAKQCGFFTVTAMGNHLNILFLYYKNYYYPWLYRPTSPPPLSLFAVHHFSYAWIISKKFSSFLLLLFTFNDRTCSVLIAVVDPEGSHASCMLFSTNVCSFHSSVCLKE